MHLNRTVDPALARSHWCLGFDHYQRNPIHQQHQIRSLLRLSRTEGELLSYHILVLREIHEVDQLDGYMLTILPKRHRTLTCQPGCEFLIHLHQPVGAHTHDQRSQPIQHIVSTIRLGFDFRIQANQRLTKMILY